MLRNYRPVAPLNGRTDTMDVQVFLTAQSALSAHARAPLGAARFGAGRLDADSQMSSCGFGGRLGIRPGNIGSGVRQLVRTEKTSTVETCCTNGAVSQ